jgi:hypothetical protein
MGKKNKLVPAEQDPMMAIIQQLFGQVMKAPPPPVAPGSGFISRKIQLWQLRDLAEASTHEATIAQNNATVAKATLETVTTMVTFPQQLRASENRIQHENKMYRAAEKAAKLDNQLKSLEKKRVKAELIQMLKGLQGGTDET